MPTNVNPDDAIENFNDILKVWKDNPELKVGEWDFKKAGGLHQKLTAGIEAIGDKEDELTELRDTCGDDAKSLQELRTRALSVIRGHFGPDSSEYERAGGTRASERKKPGRKADAPKKPEAVK